MWQEHAYTSHTVFRSLFQLVCFLFFFFIFLHSFIRFNRSIIQTMTIVQRRALTAIPRRMYMDLKRPHVCIGIVGFITVTVW